MILPKRALKNRNVRDDVEKIKERAEGLERELMEKR